MRKNTIKNYIKRRKITTKKGGASVKKWSCLQCTLLNPVTQEKCSVCGASRPWDCDKCSYTNPRELNNCKMCGNPAPWKCSQCDWNNPDSKELCNLCDEPKEKKNNSTNSWENVNDFFWKCPICKKNIPQEKKVCVSCGEDKPKKTKKTKKTKKPTTNQTEIPQNVSGCRHLTFFRGDIRNLGTFKYNNNSCWLDTTLFSLFCLGNRQIIQNLLVNPIVITDTFRRLSANLNDEKRVGVLELFRNKLCEAHNIMMLGHDNRQLLELRDVFRLCGSLRDFSSGRQMDITQLLDTLFCFYPVTNERCIIKHKRYLQTCDDELFRVKRDGNLKNRSSTNSEEVERRILAKPHNLINRRLATEQDTITAAAARALGFQVPVGQDTINIYREVFKFTIEEEDKPVFFVPMYPLWDDRNLSELITGINWQHNEISASMNNINQVTLYDMTHYHRIQCSSNYLIIDFTRAGGNGGGRWQDAGMQTNKIIPDKSLTIEDLTGREKILYLHVIMVRSAKKAGEGAHFTCYFKFENTFYYYDDTKTPPIKRIGNYQELITRRNVLRQSIVYIYQEREVQRLNYPEGLTVGPETTLPPPEDGGGGGAAEKKPKKKTTKKKPTPPKKTIKKKSLPRSRKELVALIKKRNIKIEGIEDMRTPDIRGILESLSIKL